MQRGAGGRLQVGAVFAHFRQHILIYVVGHMKRARGHKMTIR